MAKNHCTEHLYRGQVGNNKHPARIWFGKYVVVAGWRDKSGNNKDYSNGGLKGSAQTMPRSVL